VSTYSRNPDFVSSQNSNDETKIAFQTWKYPHLENPGKIQQLALVKDILGTEDKSVLGLAILGWKSVEREFLTTTLIIVPWDVLCAWHSWNQNALLLVPPQTTE
jgi:hypothetical protein